MRYLLQPANLGNIFLFLGFVSVSYSTIDFAIPETYVGEVLATCTSNGAYGQNCTPDESFSLDKKVRVKGQSSWQDKVINVKENDTVEFRIVVENTGDEMESKMKTVDTLPNEMSRIGGAALVEVWDNFDDGDKKEFIIESKLKSSEFSTSKNFEKCVVNKVDLYQNEDFKGSDTATVCYNNAEVEELPKTGPGISASAVGLFGVFFTTLGSLIKTNNIRKKN